MRCLNGKQKLAATGWLYAVALGEALHELDNLLPASSLPFDDLLAVALLLFFGLKTLQVRHHHSHLIGGRVAELQLFGACRGT